MGGALQTGWRWGLSLEIFDFLRFSGGDQQLADLAVFGWDGYISLPSLRDWQAQNLYLVSACIQACFWQHVLTKGFVPWCRLAVKCAIMGFFSPSYRAKLATLHYELCSAPSDTFSEDVTAQEQAPSVPSDTILCPACGRDMQWLLSIQPKGRHPP